MSTPSSSAGVPLGYGCAELFRAPTARARRRLLEVAFDAGIRHFDVAPMYGLGLAEAELGRFLRGHRDEVVVATKVGISPTPAARLAARLQAPVRAVLDAAPTLRRRAKSAAPGPGAGPMGDLLYHRSRFTVDTVARGVHDSLRALGVERIDLLLLHDPGPDDIPDDGVASWLEDARVLGKIGTWGIAGERDAVAAVAGHMGEPVPVRQIRDDVFRRRCSLVSAVQPGREIAYGVIGEPLRRLARLTTESPRSRAVWERAGLGGTGTSDLVSLLLQDALRFRPGRTVLFGSVREPHIRAAAAAADPASPTWRQAARLAGVIEELLDPQAARELQP